MKEPGDNENVNCIYMLRSSDGALYTGWTNDLDSRLKAHCDGRGAKYTRSKKRLKLVYVEFFSSAQEARKREAAIKKLSKQKKEALVHQVLCHGCAPSGQLVRSSRW